MAKNQLIVWCKWNQINSMIICRWRLWWFLLKILFFLIVGLIVGENPDTSVAGNRNPSPCEGDNKQNDSRYDVVFEIQLPNHLLLNKKNISSCRGTRCRRDSVFQTYVVIVVCHVAAHAALGSPLTKEEDKNGSQEVDQGEPIGAIFISN